MGCLYFESITKRKPDQALRFCKERGAHLVETINQEQLDFVRMQLQVIEEQQGTAINWWGGAVDENRNGNWMWPSGPTLKFLWVISYGAEVILMVANSTFVTMLVGITRGLTILLTMTLALYARSHTQRLLEEPELMEWKQVDLLKTNGKTLRIEMQN